MTRPSAQVAVERMRAHLDGLPVTEAASMPPGSICGLCARDLHVFVYPKDIPGSHWSLMDGCPCCETHVHDQPPLTPPNAGYPQAPEPARSVCHRCGLVLTDGLHRTGHRECTR